MAVRSFGSKAGYLASLRTSRDARFTGENYNWRSFTKLDGLLSNNVNAIAQELQGNLWFATSVGVSRYDGLWQDFTVDDGLCDNNVIDVVVDDSGLIWFGTAVGVCCFDLSSTEPQHYKSFDFSGHVLCMTQSIQNEIWVGTEQGAFFFDGKIWSTMTVASEALSTTLHENGVSAIFHDSDGKIWFGINTFPAQLSCFDGVDWSSYSVMDGLPAGQIRSICEDRDGNIWIGTSDGAAKFDGGSWQTYTVADGLAGNDIRSVMIARNGALWLATSAGVSVFDGENMSSSPSFHSRVNSAKDWLSIGKVDGLVSNDVQTVFEDRDGGIWVGTGDRGVSYTDRKWQSITAQSVLPDDAISAIFEDSRGNMWFGTPKGLVRFDGENWTTITTDDGLPGNEIRDITEIGRSSVSLDLWVGTDKGIGVYDGVGWSALTQAEGLGSNNVHAISADTAGNVWVGTGLYVPAQIDVFGGLSKFDGVNWEQMTMNSTVSCVLEDSRGSLWICTYTDGIIRINQSSIDAIRTENGLASNSVFTAVEHPDGAIWFGTSRGISVFDDGNWSTLTTDDGLVDNRVRTIFMSVPSTLPSGLWRAPQSGGSITSETLALPQIWVGTADGVSLFRDGMWSPITVDDGLLSNAISSIFVSNDGDVWFGTDKSGLTRHIREENPPKTRIINGPKGVIGVRTVTFEFIGGDASTTTAQLLYSYQLDNLSWSAFRPKIFVTFSNLADKKDHLFVVRSKDKDGNIDPIGDKAVFSIDASPPSVELDDPLQDQVISGNYAIRGSAIDKSDFKEYKIEAANFSTGWLSNSVENDLLAEWDTREVVDGIYTIELSARDTINGESDIQHTNQTSVKVEVDNTKPDVEIISPEAGFEGAGKILIEAMIADKNLKNYRLTYRQPGLDEKQLYFAESTDQIEFPLWDSFSVYGETFLRVSAEDVAGNVASDEMKIVLNNDSAKPIVEINSPAKDQVIAGDFNIVGTADDATLSEFVLEYKLWSALGRGFNNPRRASTLQSLQWKEIKSGNYPIKNELIAIWNTKEISDGIYLIRLTAVDDNGYRSSIEHRIQIDNTEPIASISLPSIIQGSVDTKIIGTADDNNFHEARLEYATLDVPGQWNLIDEPIPDAKQNETLGIWNSSGYEGKYQIRLTVVDLAGNSAEDTQVLTVDSVGVQLELVEPTASQVVSGKVEITGTARDVNFGYYSLFFRQEINPDWREIALQITEPKENERLAVWDTEHLDGIFSIKLFAVDQSGNSNELEQHGIRVDNSPPVVSIDYPKNEQQLGTIVELIGTAADDNLAEYTLEYTQYPISNQNWYSISLVPFTQSVEGGYLGTWNLPEQPGNYALKVKAIDLVGHESEAEVSVSLPQTIDAKNGGDAHDKNYRAWIIIPPNSLPSSTVITVNEIDKNVYDFEPEVVSNSLKPATISIAYSTEEQSQNIGKVPAIFFYEPDTEIWQEIGGTIDRDDQTVTAATYKTGRYALRWVEPEKELLRSRISNLTCQPPVFRPNINNLIAISFELSSPTVVAVKVYNIAGRLKRVIKRDVSMRKGSNVLRWDGKDGNDRRVLSGAYIVTVQTKDQVVQKSVVVWND